METFRQRMMNSAGFLSKLDSLCPQRGLSHRRRVDSGSSSDGHLGAALAHYFACSHPTMNTLQMVLRSGPDGEGAMSTFHSFV
ncbi:hypothetical protein MHYP_G00337540 [Metynnis hypsauchen]